MCSSADSISQQPSLCREINTPRNGKVAFQLRRVCIQTEIYILNIVPACSGSVQKMKNTVTWAMYSSWRSREETSTKCIEVRGQSRQNSERWWVFHCGIIGFYLKSLMIKNVSQISAQFSFFKDIFRVKLKRFFMPNLCSHTARNRPSFSENTNISTIVQSSGQGCMWAERPQKKSRYGHITMWQLLRKNLKLKARNSWRTRVTQSLI